MSAPAIRVLLAASDKARIRALTADLSPGIAICGIEESAQDAIAAVAAWGPDAMVLSVDLAGCALVATARVTRAAPSTKVVVVADTLDEDNCLAYLVAGASGYVTADAGGSAVAAAVRDVVRGLVIVPPAAQRRLLDELRA